MLHLAIKRSQKKQQTHIVMFENYYALKVHECYCKKSLVPFHGFIYKSLAVASIARDVGSSSINRSSDRMHKIKLNINILHNIVHM